jgi:hypothetical protein
VKKKDNADKTDKIPYKTGINKPDFKSRGFLNNMSGKSVTAIKTAP